MDRFKGIVIKKSDFQESDKIISIYTEELGKINFMLKGGKKILSKMSPHLELFNHVCVNYAEGKNFKIITGVEVLNSFPGIKKSFEKIETALRIADHFNKYIIGEATDPELFKFLIRNLTQLNNNVLVNNEAFITSFAKEFFKILGYDEESKDIPHLENKSIC